MLLRGNLLFGNAGVKMVPPYAVPYAFPRGSMGTRFTVALFFNLRGDTRLQ